MSVTATVVGAGKHTYEVDEEWAQLSNGVDVLAASVTVDANDNVYCFSRVKEHPVVVFDRETMSQIGAVGMRGANPGEFNIVHHMAADSTGNLYTAEIVTNRRAQRFVLQREK